LILGIEVARSKIDVYMSQYKYVLDCFLRQGSRILGQLILLWIVMLIGWCYCDSNWVGSRSDRRSTSGYCTFVSGNLVTWRSKK